MISGPIPSPGNTAMFLSLIHISFETFLSRIGLKADVYKRQRETEEKYQEMIRDAQAERKKSLSDAELEAENLVQKAEKDARDHRNQRLVDARAEAQNRYAEIIKEGEARAETLKAQGRCV